MKIIYVTKFVWRGGKYRGAMNYIPISKWRKNRDFEIHRSRHREYRYAI